MPKSSKPKTYLAHVAYLGGKAFLHNASSLLAQIPAGIGKANVSPETRVPQLMVAVTNVALAIELFLKSIIIRIPAVPPNCHNLIVLFEKLPSHIQTELGSAYQSNADRISGADTSGFTLFITPGKNEAQRNAPRPEEERATGRTDLRTLLSNEANAFCTWRYLHEAQAEGRPICYHVEPVYLETFARILANSIAQTYPPNHR